MDFGLCAWVVERGRTQWQEFTTDRLRLGIQGLRFGSAGAGAWGSDSAGEAGRAGAQASAAKPTASEMTQPSTPRAAVLAG